MEPVSTVVNREAESTTLPEHVPRRSRTTLTISMLRYDAVIVGSGPNGLAAAITLARAGRSVLVIEGRDTVGGGMRTAELTLPGFRHDICSAVHPLGMASPFFRSLPLEQHGLRWIQPDAPLAHPLDDGQAVVVERSFEATAAYLGRDAAAYRRLIEPLAEQLAGDPGRPAGAAERSQPPGFVCPLRRWGDPAGRHAGAGLVPPRAGAGAVCRPLRPFHHAAGAPIDRGLRLDVGDAGPCGRLADAGRRLAIHRRRAGVLPAQPGRRDHDRLVGAALDELPPADAYLFDITPKNLLRIAGDALPAGYRRTLSRYRYGPGVFKLDYALDGPIPWRNPACSRGRHRSPGRHAGGDRRLGAGRLAGPPRRATLRAAGAAQPVRSQPRAGRPAHGSGPTATSPTAPPWT